MKLTSENAQTWLSALRSGEYVQGDNRLHKLIWSWREDGTRERVSQFCCLGVGCEVAGFPKKLHDHYQAYVYVPEVSSSVGTPPREFWAWLGLEDASDAGIIDWPQGLRTPGDFSEEFYQDGVLESCMRLNDSGLFSFSQIADIVEYFGIKPLSTR